LRLAREAFKDGGRIIRLHVVTDGEAALNFLLRRGVYRDAPVPNIVLLDLNLPKRNGREVLAEIKRTPEIQRIPVAVLTTSESEEDIAQCYELGANCYLAKPVDIEKFRAMVNSLHEFWFGSVRLP